MPPVPVSRARQHRLTLPAALFALFLSLLWSANPIAIKVGLHDAPPLRLGWLRFVAGGVVVLVWGIGTRIDLRPWRGEWAPLALLGALFTVQLACMNLGLSLTSAGHSAVLNLSFPIWVAVFAHFLIPGDRLAPRKLVGVLLAYAGILTLFGQSLGAAGDQLGAALGDLLSALSGLLLGARQVYSARTVHRIHPAKLLLAQAVCGTAVFVLASALLEPVAWRWTTALALSVAYQGVVIAGFGFIGNLWLLARYLPSQVSLLSLSQPLFSVTLAWLLLGEPPGPTLWLSALLITAGAALVQRRPRSSEPAPVFPEMRAELPPIAAGHPPV